MLKRLERAVCSGYPSTGRLRRGWPSRFDETSSCASSRSLQARYVPHDVRPCSGVRRTRSTSSDFCTREEPLTPTVNSVHPATTRELFGEGKTASPFLSSTSVSQRSRSTFRAGLHSGARISAESPTRRHAYRQGDRAGAHGRLCCRAVGLHVDGAIFYTRRRTSACQALLMRISLSLFVSLFVSLSLPTPSPLPSLSAPVSASLARAAHSRAVASFDTGTPHAA